MALAAVTLVVLSILTNRARHAFLVVLALLLGGYAFFGRAFAYLGMSSVYVGELALAFGILAALLGQFRAGWHWVLWVLLGFLTWGVVTTAPYLPRDGIDAFRDGVLWGYGLYALLVVRALDGASAWRIVSVYHAAYPLFLAWVPAAVLASRMAGDLPSVPGTDVPILTIKLGDAGVHLAGIAAFVVLGVHNAPVGTTAPLRALVLPLYLISLGFVAVLNRGGLLAAASASAALAVAKPSRAWAIGALSAAVLALGLVVADPLARLEIGAGRLFSAEQIGENLLSIFTDTGSSTLEGTRAFRLAWWGAIVDYTVLGPYFWTGKGFGVNLGIDDGFLTSLDDPARDPHNTHFTVLARMGVPGLLVWIALQSAFAYAVVAAFVRARAGNMGRRSRVLAWILVYWLAMLVNTSFDPYLESPMGGIWFWSVFGFGLAVASNEDWFRSGVRSPPQM